LISSQLLLLDISLTELTKVPASALPICNVLLYCSRFAAAVLLQ
jgi:hypothetical protein